MGMPRAASRSDVAGHGRRRREVDRHVDPAEALRRDAVAAGVVPPVRPQGDLEAVLRERAARPACPCGRSRPGPGGARRLARLHGTPSRAAGRRAAACSARPRRCGHSALASTRKRTAGAGVARSRTSRRLRSSAARRPGARAASSGARSRRSSRDQARPPSARAPRPRRGHLERAGEGRAHLGQAVGAVERQRHARLGRAQHQQGRPEALADARAPRQEAVAGVAIGQGVEQVGVGAAGDRLDRRRRRRARPADQGALRPRDGAS